MKLQIKKGTTSKLLDIFIQDSSSTTGAGLTGLTYNSAGLTAYYYREGAASPAAITLATMTLGTWATGGFVVVDGTNMPGCYQLGIPDAALATGANSVIVMLKGATNMAPLVLEIELVAFDNQTAIAQTGDAYAVVNNGTYGNAQLVRSTTPANTLDVSATGEAGLDFNNIKQATGATTLNNVTVPIVTTLTNAPSDSSGVTTLLSRIASALTITTGKVDVNDKTGFSISGTKTTLDALNDISAASILTTALTESYATDGSTATLSQLLYMIWSGLVEFSISGTTITCKKLDGATTAMTFTLNDGTNPTSRTRAT